MNQKFGCLVFLINIFLISKAQTGIPPFSTKDTVLSIPAFLPGVMIDSSAAFHNDTLTYELNAQIFGANNYKIPLNKPATNLATPWETLFEMADAYSKKNVKRIIGLYASGSKEQISKVLMSPQGAKLLDYFSKAANANLRIIGGMKYKDGFIAYTKEDFDGVHENFIVKENGKYKLSALNDMGTAASNVALYFKFEPKPMFPLHVISTPDSLKLEGNGVITATLPSSAWWIAIYFDRPGGPVSLLVQDNGINDKNPAPRQVTFSLNAEIFISRGVYKFYAASFNYPVQRVSTSMITEQGVHKIKIY